MKIKNIILMSIFLATVSPIAADAVTFEKSSFAEGEPLYFSYNKCLAPNSNSVNLYDLTTGENLGGFPCTDNNNGNLVLFGWNAVFPRGEHHYSLIEVTVNTICEDSKYTYSQCKGRPEFVNEFLFDITGQAYKGTGQQMLQTVVSSKDTAAIDSKAGPLEIIGSEEKIRSLRIEILRLQIQILQAKLQQLLGQ